MDFNNFSLNQNVQNDGIGGRESDVSLQKKVQTILALGHAWDICPSYVSFECSLNTL